MTSSTCAHIRNGTQNHLQIGVKHLEGTENTSIRFFCTSQFTRPVEYGSGIRKKFRLSETILNKFWGVELSIVP